MSSQALYDQISHTPHILAALEQLLEARRGALSLKLDAWSLAVELPSLQGTGCTVPELRLLVAAGYADHRQEVTQPSDPARTFRPEPRITFGPRSCFVLTEAGAELLARLGEESDLDKRKPKGQAGWRKVPRWSVSARELRVDGRVLKRFRRPAPNLELVLAAFEEEDWPKHLDDPLPGEPDIDPQQRLHDTVRRLNDCQQPHRIHFESDGLGAGIRWRWADRESG